MDCAAAPCGKCFQSGLLKSAICPHDGLAALGKMHPGRRFGKKRKFSENCLPIVIHKAVMVMAISICTLIFKDGSLIHVF